MSQQLKQKLIEKEQQITDNRKKSQIKLFFSLLFTFQRNYDLLLAQNNSENTRRDLELVNAIPGYRKYQLIFLYYFRKYGVLKSLIISLLFPLPFTILFYFIAPILQGIQVSNQLQIVLIGLRCSVISYLCRYCIHFPQQKLNWFIYVGSMVCALISNNNFTFIVIYILSIFLSYFKSVDRRGRSSTVQQQVSSNQWQLKNAKMSQIPHRKVYVIGIISFFLLCWIAQRLYISSNNHYYLVQLFIISLLNTNQQMSIFFPELYSHFTHNTNIYTGNIYCLGYLLPGLHLKTFFLLFNGENIIFLVTSYLALHLPSLLMACIGLGYRKIFYSQEWKLINSSIQAVGNGLVLIAVITLLKEQSCQSNIVFFTSLVIFTVTKLYKFNEVISAMLGIFLVASRASVLQEIPFIISMPQRMIVYNLYFVIII